MKLLRKKIVLLPIFLCCSATVNARDVDKIAQANNKTSHWVYAADVDPMTGKVDRIAALESVNIVNLKFPYEGNQRGTLAIQRSRNGNYVMFYLKKGQIICHDNCSVLVRFDDAAPITFAATRSNDLSSELIFFYDYRRFMSKMLASKKTRIMVTIHNDGSNIFEFDVGQFSQQKYEQVVP